jgi:hypothetical protein
MPPAMETAEMKAAGVASSHPDLAKTYLQDFLALR